MLQRLHELAEQSAPDAVYPFDEFEESVIPSVAFDLPDYFQGIAHLLEPELFSTVEIKYVMSYILDHYDKYRVAPTRQAIRSQALRGITVDDTNWQVVRDIIDRPTDHRDLPLVKDVLHSWARKRAYGRLYEPDAMQAFSRGDFTRLEDIIHSAAHIGDVSAKGFWLYEQYEELFLPDSAIHYPTGFGLLDVELNNGGPSPGEVVCWMAATNVGKSLMLCNNAIQQTIPLNDRTPGRDVLLVTFELDQIKTAMRCMGVLTGVDVKNIVSHKEAVRKKVEQAQAGGYGRICIYDLPPDECSVNEIYHIIHTLRRTQGWSPQVVVLDYLDLMIGRRDADNKDDYTRQKHVATQVRGLARNEKVLVFTATQGNRASTDTSQLLDLNKIAESYGKSMSLDYIISMNQDPNEHERGELRLFVAKNRNGRKRVTIECTVNYANMQLRQRMAS